jgi:hypothetical protein
LSGAYLAQAGRRPWRHNAGPPGTTATAARPDQPGVEQLADAPAAGIAQAAGAGDPVSIQAPHMLKALMRYDSNISRCQLRGGIHLEQSYVSDMCLSSRFNQCVFYEDELRPR